MRKKDYIVASIGNSGSRLMVQMIEAASGLTHCNDDTENWRRMILHTHRPFDEKDKRLRPHNWKGVYIWSHIGDAITGMVEGRIALKSGLRLMGVDSEAIGKFLNVMENYPVAAWVELIKDDKLRWRENILSWMGAPNTMVINYELFCLEPVGTCALLSQFMDLEIPPPALRPRLSNFSRLPEAIHDAVQQEYEDLIRLGDRIKSVQRFYEMTNLWKD